ncbi:MAG: hypothetical protein PHS86_05920 [Syntrophaceae bacterium]|nr:hypothetical protein [Syntrophaceae bacterium]
MIFATNGREALKVISELKEEISLVFLDLIIPLKVGVSCLQELLALDPSQKIVIINGYHGEATANDLMSAGAKLQSINLLSLLRS